MQEKLDQNGSFAFNLSFQPHAQDLQEFKHMMQERLKTELAKINKSK